MVSPTSIHREVAERGLDQLSIGATDWFISLGILSDSKGVYGPGYAIEFGQRGGNRFCRRRHAHLPFSQVHPKCALVAGPGVSALIGVAIGYPLRHPNSDGHLTENDVCIGDADIGHVCNNRIVKMVGSSVQ